MFFVENIVFRAKVFFFFKLPNRKHLVLSLDNKTKLIQKLKQRKSEAIVTKEYKLGMSTMLDSGDQKNVYSRPILKYVAYFGRRETAPAREKTDLD